MESTTTEALRERLAEYVTQNKRERFANVLAQRTRWLTVVLEDVYQSHNFSACLRSCDAFGVQDVHIIERENRFALTEDVALGSDQWLTLHRHRGNEQTDATEECFARLRDAGYAIIAATPHSDRVDVAELPLSKPTALVFGTEISGLTEIALAGCDGFAAIPMVGFVESLNVSVACAVALSQLTNRLRTDSISWQFSDIEKRDLELQWMRFVVQKHWPGLLQRIESRLAADVGIREGDVQPEHFISSGDGVSFERDSDIGNAP